MSTLLAQLKKLRDPANRRLDAGICVYLNDADSAEFKGLAMRWPKHSGNKGFPVPSTTKGRSPLFDYANTEDLWAGESGKLRLELLEWCIEQLEKEQADVEKS